MTRRINKRRSGPSLSSEMDYTDYCGWARFDVRIVGRAQTIKVLPSEGPAVVLFYRRVPRREIARVTGIGSSTLAKLRKIGAWVRHDRAGDGW